MPPQPKGSTRRLRRIQELLALAKDPLDPVAALEVPQVLSAAEAAGKKGPLDLSVLGTITDEASFKKALLHTVNTRLHQPSPAPSGIPQKRKVTDDARERLLAHRQRRKRPSSALASIKSHQRVAEQQQQHFLSKSLDELEVVAVPEHYPTNAHNVSSLAELYYLTQTLPLMKLLPGSHKTLMTDNFELALFEGKIAVLYSRIEELKRQNKWLLKQPLRYYDPFVYNQKKQPRTQHWSTLLDEAKWMAADFKELAKYKKACCVMLAQAISDFWTYGKVMCIKRKHIYHIGDERPEEDRLVLPAPEPEQVEVKLDVAPQLATEEGPVKMEVDGVAEPEVKQEPEAILDIPEPVEPVAEPVAEPEPEPEVDELDPAPEGFVPLTEEEATSAIDVHLLLSRPKPEDEITPRVLPTFSPEELQKVHTPSPFKMHVNLKDLSKVDHSIIDHLPKFGAFDDDDSLAAPPLKPKELPMVAILRLLHPFDEDDDWYKVVLREAPSSKKKGAPEYQKGLFGLLSRRQYNTLKPPKPPLVKNIEYRSPTIWLPQDDKYLIHYVAEFCFNWDLISEHLSATAATLRKYESNIERRTPWQCFERYIQLNEKFQFSDMKGLYAYHAQQWLEQAHRAQSTTKRRILPLGVGNESIQRGHRRLRWASMFDAMRKSMRKREVQAAKIAQRKATSLSSTTESTNPPNGATTTNTVAKRASDRVPTPAELSRLKFERDKSIQEAYMTQQATRLRMMAAVAQQQRTKQPGQTESPTSDTGPKGAPSLQARLAQPAQLQNVGPRLTVPPRPASASLATAAPAQTAQRPQTTGNATGASGLTLPQQVRNFQGNKRPTTPNGTPYTPEQIQQLIQIQKQRRLMQQQQQQQAGKQGLNPGQTNLAMNQLNRPAQTSAGAAPSSLTRSTSGTAAPAGAAATQPGQKARIQFAPAQVSAIINSIQTKNPNLTKEQVTRLAATYLANIQQQQQNRIQNRTGQQPTQVARQLTPQERTQLQMLKAKTQVPPPEASMLKLQYEERKKLLMQKQQQQQQHMNGDP